MALRRLKSTFGRRVSRLIGGRLLLKDAKTRRKVKTKLREKRSAITKLHSQRGKKAAKTRIKNAKQNKLRKAYYPGMK